MSFDVLFDFRSGLAKPVRAPKGTLKRWKETVLATERNLCLKRETWQAKERWVNTHNVPAEVTDDVYCETAATHNEFVAWLHEFMDEWQENPRDDFETIQPDDVNGFWFDALVTIDVPTGRWTRDFYRARMDALFDTLRGRPQERMTFDSEPLTESQAKDVIILLSQWLDRGDIRLDCPKGYDALYSMYSGEYDWCPAEGAIHAEDTEAHGWSCTEEHCEIDSTYSYDPEDEDRYGCPPSARVKEAMSDDGKLREPEDDDE